MLNWAFAGKICRSNYLATKMKAIYTVQHSCIAVAVVFQKADREEIFFCMHGNIVTLDIIVYPYTIQL